MKLICTNYFYEHSISVFAADSTLDSGMGSTVYSDSHSSQQSVLYQSQLEPIAMTTQQVCIRRIHSQVDYLNVDLSQYTHANIAQVV